MRKIRFAFAAAAVALSATALAEVPKPAALTADGIPPIPDELGG